MKIQTECVPCLLKRVIFEAELSTKDKNLQVKTLKNALKTLAEFYDPNVCSASIATKVHKAAYETLGNKDPYRKLKKLSNETAEKLVPRVEELIKKSDNPLKTSMICSIVGNMMDFGIEGGSKKPEDLIDIFEKYVNIGLGYDDYDKVKEVLKNSRNVLFFTDNCGEVVFDKILCRELKKAFPHVFLTVVVKGEYILSDATMEDALSLGFDKTVDEILTTGSFAVGVDFDKIPSILRERLDNCDLIICKGMANYESFSETNYKPIVYLLRTKCIAIANSMVLPLNINAIKLYQ